MASFRFRRRLGMDLPLKHPPETPKVPTRARLGKAEIQIAFPLLDDEGREIQTAKVGFSLQDPRLSDEKREALQGIAVRLAELAGIVDTGSGIG
jgi:hypothetical protein